MAEEDAGYAEVAKENDHIVVGGESPVTAAIPPVAIVLQQSVQFSRHPVVLSLNAAVQDFRIGLPGILIQIFGAYLIVKTLANRE